MFSDRAITICFLEILKEYSDEAHILTMKEIRTKMEGIYGLKPDRRTIYGAISVLIDLGYDLSVYEENQKGYYLRSQNIEHSEVIMLTNAVYAFPFISASQSEDIIKKLQKFLSVHQRKQQRHLTIVPGDKKTTNKQLFWNIEQLNEAISQKKQVSFLYLKYNTKKELISRREAPYIVNPYTMLYLNEHYYLACSYLGIEKTSLYRVDKMKDVQILEDKWTMPPTNSGESKNSIYAFAGTPEYITVRCDNLILDDVIDRFGTEIRIREIDENHFQFKAYIPPNGIKFWALQYLAYAEVLEPQWLRDEIVDSLKDNKYGCKIL